MDNNFNQDIGGSKGRLFMAFLGLVIVILSSIMIFLFTSERPSPDPLEKYVAGFVLVVFAIIIFVPALLFKPQPAVKKIFFRFEILTGLAFLAVGFFYKDWSVAVFLGLGTIIASLISKFRQKRMEKSSEPLSDQTTVNNISSKEQKQVRIFFMVLYSLAAICSLPFLYFRYLYVQNNVPEPITEPKTSLDMMEAVAIAEESCIKGEEFLGLPVFNKEIEAWVFDINLSIAKEGCEPVCAVFEDSKSAEIKWRCAGVISAVGDETGVITNFEKCLAAGNPVIETYPRQCRANGEAFVEQIVGQEIK